MCPIVSRPWEPSEKTEPSEVTFKVEGNSNLLFRFGKFWQFGHDANCSNSYQTVPKLFKLLRIFHLCVCWSGPVIDVWSLHVGCLWCLWCLRFICRICTALSWKSQHQREDWANTLNKCWSLSQTSCSDIVFVFLSIICIIWIISISYPFVSLWRFPNPSQRFPFHSWSCHAMTDPISHEFSRARDMPSERENPTPIFAQMHDRGDATLAQLPPWHFW
jgi:hypothetical protein